MNERLLLHEELFLLALNDETGVGRVDLGVAGGMLADLVFAGAIEVENVKRDWQVHAVPFASSTNQLLAECVDDIRVSTKVRSAGHWVGRFGRKKDLRHRIAEPLVQRGILSEEKRKRLLFTATRYPELDPGPEAEMTERLRSAILHDVTETDERTIALVSLGNASGLLTNNLDRKMLRQRKERISELSENPIATDAVKVALDGINAAMISLIVGSTLA
jgi:hypothetical protein